MTGSGGGGLLTMVIGNGDDATGGEHYWLRVSGHHLYESAYLDVGEVGDAHDVTAESGVSAYPISRPNMFFNMH